MELILERLAAEQAIDRVVESYPRLDGESVGRALLFAAGRVEEMLARLGLTEESLGDAVTALDEHSEEDEKTEAPPRRCNPDEAEPPALLAVAEKVLPPNAPWYDVCRGWRIPTADALPVVGDTSDAHGFRTPCLGMDGKSVDLGPVPVRGRSASAVVDLRMGTMAEIVLCHSALGLRPGVIAVADRLPATGHKVRTPDYYDGQVFDDLDEGLLKCDALGYAEIARSAREAVADLPAELVFAGFSLGTVPAEQLAAGRPGAHAQRRPRRGV